jgi:hypothetical protein
MARFKIKFTNELSLIIRLKYFVRHFCAGIDVGYICTSTPFEFGNDLANFPTISENLFLERKRLFTTLLFCKLRLTWRFVEPTPELSLRLLNLQLQRQRCSRLERF